MSVSNTVPPAITGTPVEGNVLSTSSGSWDFDLDYLTYAYQWLRCDSAGANCNDIGGATTASYTLAGADVGSTIRSEVTASEHSYPPPGSLPFSEPVLDNPITPALSALSGSSFVCNNGADYLIDLDWVPRSNTLILSGTPRRVQIVNAYFRITTPSFNSPYSRGGLGLQLRSEHVGITDYFCQGDHSGVTLTDAFRVAADEDTKITLQRARLEGRSNTPEPAEHCDAYQVQGPVGSLEIGLVTAQAPGVQAPNDGGKCFQIAHEPWPGTTYGGPFTADFKQVNMVGLGTGGGRFGTMFIRGPRAHHNTGVFVGTITETLEDVYAVAAGTYINDFSGWFYVYDGNGSGGPTAAISGSAPTRTATFSATPQLISDGVGGSGLILEGYPPAGDYVPRSLLAGQGLVVVP